MCIFVARLFSKLIEMAITDMSAYLPCRRSLWTPRGTAAPNLPALDRNGREPPNCAVATRSTPPPPSRWWSLPAPCQPSVDVSRGSGVHHNRCAATARCRNTTWRRLPAARAKSRTRRQRLSSLLAASPRPYPAAGLGEVRRHVYIGHSSVPCPLEKITG